MTVPELLSALNRRQVKLWVEGDRLRYQAGVSLEPEVLAELRRHKEEILGVLRSATAPSSATVSIAPVPRNGPLPLSFAQQRLWFLEQLEPGTGLYNIPQAFRLRGQLDAAALEESFNALIARHESLRTAFSSADGNPVQVISPEVRVQVVMEDYTSRPEAERFSEALRRAGEEAGRPFDLSQAPLLRVHLLYLGAEDHLLVVNLHHIISDGWSMEIILRELSRLYRGATGEAVEALPALPVQYADYGCRQREWLQGEALATQRDYWRERLADAPPHLDLPLDFPRPTVQAYAGAECAFRLPAALASSLRALSRAEGVTLYVTLLAAFNALLHRYSGQTDLLVGTPVTNRNQAELEGVVGFFVNMVVVRTQCGGNPTFLELLRRARETVIGAMAHQDLPFEKLVEELHPSRTAACHPYFQAVFALQNSAAQSLELPGVASESVPLFSGRAKFDLACFMNEEGEGMSGVLVYNTALFAPATIQRMLRHFENLLRGLAAEPGKAISELPLLSPAEEAQLVVGWNETRRPYPRDKCVHEIFEAQAARSPEAVALVCRQEQCSYGDLNQRANQLARRLRSMGVRADMPVGICLERSIEMVVGILAILKAGGAYVPLDAAHDPSGRLSFILKDTGARVLLTQSSLRGRFDGFSGQVLCLDTDGRMFLHEPAENPAATTDPNGLAYVMYTSGSAGEPKGVEIPHRAINRLVLGSEYVALGPNRVLLQLAPFSFDASTFELWGALLHGARCVLYPGNTPVFSELGPVIRKCLVDTVWLTASLFNAVIDDAPESLRGVRQLLVGGEPLSIPHVRRALKLLPDCQLINGYGPTENTTFTCCFRVPRELPDTLGSIPIGRPIANTTVYLLDAYLHPVPIGVAGEILTGGDGLARGYLRRPELTAEKFIPNPFRPGERLYKTGDRARYLSDGTIEFLGRMDQQVKIRGFRIEPGEIEAVLRGHPSHGEAAVVVQELMPGEKRLVAYFVTKQNPAPSEDALRQYLKQRVPDYMIPSVFLVMERFPLTPSGKLDRRALPWPAFNSEHCGEDAELPDLLESRLQTIFSQVLRREKVGREESFFDLGGHSMLAVRLVHMIEKTLGRRLPLATLFQAPSVARLADLLRQEGWMPSWESLVPIQPHGTRRPIFFIHGVGGNVLSFRDLARYLEPDQPVYGLQAVGLDGRQDPLGRIEAMAAHYIKEMRAFQPDGPYFLAGMSFGGIVAFEMARQLHLQGQKVGLLALLDTQLPNFSETITRMEWLKREAAFLARRTRLHAGNLVRLPWPEKVHYLRRKFHTIKRQTRSRLWQRAYASYLDRGIPLPDVLKNVQEFNFLAAVSYHPKVYPGVVTLFHAEEQGIGRQPNLPKLWEKLALGGVELHRVPGDHVSIVREPNVRTLARQITECLHKAQSAPAAP